jgi:hypothetical protein
MTEHRHQFTNAFTLRVIRAVKAGEPLPLATRAHELHPGPMRTWQAQEGISLDDDETPAGATVAIDHSREGVADAERSHAALGSRPPVACERTRPLPQNRIPIATG